MAFYNNTNKASLLSAVEFSPVSDGNSVFFYASDAGGKDNLKQWLASPEIGQTVITEAVVNGRPVLVTRGSKTDDELMRLMAARGEKLELVPPPKKSVDTWKLIAMLAVPGQMMQMASSLMQVGKKLDWGLFVFAASNLLGHVIGWRYGSQKSDDEYREDFFKQQINNNLSRHLPDGCQLPGIQEDLASRRVKHAAEQTTWQKTNDFLRKNSVTFGEIFLRYFGAFALAFPVNRWKSAAKTFMRGQSWKEIWKAARNPTLTHYAGLMSLTGKTIALGSKVPDPYDPKPHSWLDTIREKYTFRTGGWIETMAFGTMTYDAAKSNRQIRFGDRTTKDYLGIVGSAMFTIRYMVRHWAKYGEKAIDMEEMRAHVTAGLATMSPEKLPQLLAETAADLTEHFKEKNLRFGEVYTQLKEELYRYHHIAIPAGSQPEAGAAVSAEPGQTAKSILAQGPRAMMGRVAMPGKHADASKASETPMQMGA